MSSCLPGQPIVIEGWQKIVDSDDFSLSQVLTNMSKIKWSRMMLGLLFGVMLFEIHRLIDQLHDSLNEKGSSNIASFKAKLPTDTPFVDVALANKSSPWFPQPVEVASVSQIEWLYSKLEALQSTIDQKADKSEVQQLQANKADKSQLADLQHTVTSVSENLTRALRLPPSCVGLPDGETLLHIGSTTIYAKCSKGWIIIDPSIESEWRAFFGDWTLMPDFHVAAPSHASYCSDHITSFLSWFKLSAETALSEDCMTIKEGSEGKAYYASGNFINAAYYNRNCDTDTDVMGSCFKCHDNYHAFPTEGTCTHLIRPAGQTFRGTCSADWWNRFPVVGISGKFCMAFKQL